MFEKACNKYALMVIYRCKDKVLKKVKEMNETIKQQIIEKAKENLKESVNYYDMDYLKKSSYYVEQVRNQIGRIAFDIIWDNNLDIDYTINEENELVNRFFEA